ncbi:hypothetical protein SY89_02560 [Halolamina pelagica]|uniref:Uncharacterized protein n=1 Tax=Halolamina pelagica TaxID=699431 RepID=A0A0P7I4B1_9EURY|nr:hypothetical protein SY89_02560 [Halolamina pelagica]
MDSETTRRALLSAVLGAGVGGMALTDARSYLQRFAPGSGSVWSAATENAPAELSSPYGPATVRYDDYHVPTSRPTANARRTTRPVTATAPTGCSRWISTADC